MVQNFDVVIIGAGGAGLRRAGGARGPLAAGARAVADAVETAAGLIGRGALVIGVGNVSFPLAVMTGIVG